MATELLDRYEQLNFVSDLARQVNPAGNPLRMFTLVTDKIAQLFGADYVITIFHKGTIHHLSVADDVPAVDSAALTEAIQRLCQRVANQACPGSGTVVVNDIRTPAWEEASTSLFTAVLATPIMVDNQYYGTLNILTVGHQMLERLGYEVVATTSSSEALETFRTHPNTFDVVITDQIMPHVSDELAQELLRMQPNIPIILITGFSQLFGPEHAKNLGIRAYLEKPLAADDLGEAIRRVLNKASKEI